VFECASSSAWWLERYRESQQQRPHALPRASDVPVRHQRGARTNECHELHQETIAQRERGCGGRAFERRGVLARDAQQRLDRRQEVVPLLLRLVATLARCNDEARDRRLDNTVADARERCKETRTTRATRDGALLLPARARARGRARGGRVGRRGRHSGAAAPVGVPAAGCTANIDRFRRRDDTARRVRHRARTHELRSWQRRASALEMRVRDLLVPQEELALGHDDPSLVRLQSSRRGLLHHPRHPHTRVHTQRCEIDELRCVPVRSRTRATAGEMQRVAGQRGNECEGNANSAVHAERRLAEEAAYRSQKVRKQHRRRVSASFRRSGAFSTPPRKHPLFICLLARLLAYPPPHPHHEGFNCVAVR